MCRSGIRHVLVDRDGVLNREAESGWIIHPDEWVWERGAVDGLRRLTDAGCAVSVVTNQSCIGRGLATAAEVDHLHRWMSAELRRHGVELAGVHVCPHRPEDRCACRKPEPGLLLAALGTSGVERGAAIMVGDDVRDLEAGRSAGTNVALLRTGKGSTVGVLPTDLDVFDDLWAFSEWLVGRRAAGGVVPVEVVR